MSAFEFAEPQRATKSISQHIELAALGLKKPDEIGARHLESLVPAQRLPNAPIQLEVLLSVQLFCADALVSGARGNGRWSRRELEVAHSHSCIGGSTSHSRSASSDTMLRMIQRRRWL